MIVLNLECERGHPFEGWFKSALAFEHQLAHGLISCPQCGNTDIVRRPSAPYVQTHSAPSQPRPPATAAPDKASDLAERILAHLRNEARGMEDVGQRFAEEARKIHHGDAESRGIRGQATSDELVELLDEGIAVLPIPPDEALH